jgi:hypothetical protein
MLMSDNTGKEWLTVWRETPGVQATDNHCVHQSPYTANAVWAALRNVADRRGGADVATGPLTAAAELHHRRHCRCAPSIRWR